MCGNFLDGLFQIIETTIAVFLLVVFTLLGIIFFGKSESDYREIVVNELCQKKQYDFCEVSTYKLKMEE